MEKISSRQNPLIRRVAKLQERKYRDAEKLFLINGLKLSAEAIMADLSLPYIFLRSDSVQKCIDWLRRETGDRIATYESAFIAVDDAVFDKISTEKSPEGVICVARYIDKCHKTATIEGKIAPMPENRDRMLILESIRDPGNLGTIIRSASALGVSRLVLSRDCADLYNPKTVRASMGTLFHQAIDIVEAPLSEYIRLVAQNRRVFATALDHTAKKLGSFPLAETDCFVIGNEGHGISADTLEACPQKVFIPMQEGTESLNAAIAATICMWELARTQQSI